MAPDPSPETGWTRHLRRLVEAATLILSIEASEHAFSDYPIPLLAKAAAVAVLLLAPGERPGARPGARRRFLVRLPVLAGVAAAAAGLFFAWSRPPSRFYLFAPAWIGSLVAASALGSVARPVLGAADRGLRAAVRAFPRVRDAAVRLRLDVALGYALAVGAFVVFSRGFFEPAGAASGRGAAVRYGYLVLFAACYAGALRRSARRRGAVAENCRWIVLGACWVLLMHPFLGAALQGTPDAAWYGTMLADMLEQVRSGVFPVFAGQSPYQFNGAIYPLRVAPAFHYLGALVDTLTLRTLGAFAVQNLLLSLQALAALLSCYVALAAVIPGRRWCACALAILYLACPGVLGIVYNTDLYMSWMTVPLLPVAFYGLVRFHRRGDTAAALVAGGALGLTWWGHTPIALWATLLVGATLALRVAAHPPRPALARSAALGGGLLALIAAYPVLSVLAFPPEAGAKTASFQLALPSTVALFLRQAFPGVLLPLSPNGRHLSDFQVGYALWILLGLCLWSLRRVRTLDYRLLLGVACLLVVLLAPIPGVSTALWSMVPGFVRNTTGNWVMNRLYLLLAASLVFAGAIALDRVLLAARREARGWVYGLLGIACAWSLAEARKFAAGSAEHPRTSAGSAALLQPENAMVTQFAYLVFPRRPERFTHGVADPLLENRILSQSGDAVLQDNALSIPLEAGNTTETAFIVDERAYAGRALVAKDPIVLRPGARYLAEFTFARPGELPGVLQISGRTFFREYLLPSSGGELAFGSAAGNARRLSLWTSAAEPEALTVRFFPATPMAMAGSLPFARIRVAAYDPAALPVRVDGWMPYHARLQAAAAGWLETPRMYQTGYRAQVDGRPAEIRESPDGLLRVAVPRGASQVTLEFRAPPGLVIAFFVSVTAALGWAAWVGYRFARAPGHAAAP